MKQKLLIFLLYFSPLLWRGAGGEVHAQTLDTLKRDSLINLIKKYDAQKKELGHYGIVQADTQKAILLYDILSCDDNYKNAKAWHARFDELKKISNALNYKKGIANSLAAEATDLASKLEYKKAMEHGKKALKLREQIGDDWGIRWSYFHIGACYQWQNINKDAMPWYMKSLKLAEAAKDSVLLYYIYAGLSGIYQSMGDIKEATSFSEKSAANINSPKTKAEYCLALVFLADCYADSKEFTKADSVFVIAKKIATEMNNFYYLSYYYNMEATVAEKRGNHGQAILAYSTSVAMEDSMKAGQNKPYSLHGIAENILRANKQQLAIAGISEAKKYDEVIRYSQLSLDITIPSNIMSETASNYKNLSIAYEAKGDMKQAYKYFKMSTEIKDSLYNAENTKTINGLKMQYESEKKEQQIVLLNKDKKIQQTEIAKQQTTRNAFIGGFVLVLLMAGVTYNRYRVKQITNRQLSINLERLKNTQSQLVENEKLASLGQLTAGIAHEIKNPLNFVNNFSELSKDLIEEIRVAKNAEEQMQVIADLKENIERIKHHGNRAGNIVKSMMLHSRGSTGEKQLTNINVLCDDVLNLSYKNVTLKFPKFQCEVIKNFQSDLQKINCDREEISRVILNLLDNAFYAVRARSEGRVAGDEYKPNVTLSTLVGCCTLP